MTSSDVIQGLEEVERTKRWRAVTSSKKRPYLSIYGNSSVFLIWIFLSFFSSSLSLVEQIIRRRYTFARSSPTCTARPSDLTTRQKFTMKYLKNRKHSSGLFKFFFFFFFFSFYVRRLCRWSEAWEWIIRMWRSWWLRSQRSIRSAESIARRSHRKWERKACSRGKGKRKRGNRRKEERNEGRKEGRGWGREGREWKRRMKWKVEGRNLAVEEYRRRGALSTKKKHKKRKNENKKKKEKRIPFLTGFLLQLRESVRDWHGGLRHSETRSSRLVPLRKSRSTNKRELLRHHDVILRAFFLFFFCVRFWESSEGLAMRWQRMRLPKLGSRPH